jgi:hypothetical protein
MSFEIRAEGVDLERLLAEVQRRVEERRGTLYTEEELRFIAERPLEGVVQPHDVRADLLEEFRRRDGSWNYTFDAQTLYRSSRGLAGRAIEAARRLLGPVQKLFWNPNPMVAALSRQSDLNRFSVDLLHNLVLELTRLSLEVQELRSRNLELASRIDALARREKTLEGMVAYRPDGGRTEPTE